jgi:hypothetical protein
MAIGDDAALAGYPLVPNTGEEGRVRFGAREINRTRDFIAQVKALIPATWPVNKGGTGATTAQAARVNLGITGAITMGTDNPTGGASGDIYFKYTA